MAKQANISFQDSGKMTPMERQLILQFIMDDLKMQQNIINAQLAKQG